MTHPVSGEQRGVLLFQRASDGQILEIDDQRWIDIETSSTDAPLETPLAGD